MSVPVPVQWYTMNILTGQDSNEGDHCQSSPYIVIIFNLPGGIDYYIFSH